MWLAMACLSVIFSRGRGGTRSSRRTGRWGVTDGWMVKWWVFDSTDFWGGYVLLFVSSTVVCFGIVRCSICWDCNFVFLVILCLLLLILWFYLFWRGLTVRQLEKKETAFVLVLFLFLRFFAVFCYNVFGGWALARWNSPFVGNAAHHFLDSFL